MLVEYPFIQLVVQVIFWIVTGLAGLMILFALVRALGQEIAKGFIDGLQARGMKGVLLLEGEELREEEI